MFLSAIITFFIEIESKYFIKKNKYYEIQKSHNDFELLTEKLHNLSEILVFTINEYNINITTKYIDLYPISKLYRDVIKDLQKLNKYISENLFNKNLKNLTIFIDEKYIKWVENALNFYKLEYKTLIFKIQKILDQNIFEGDIFEDYLDDLSEFSGYLNDFFDNIEVYNSDILCYNFKIIREFELKLKYIDDETVNLIQTIMIEDKNLRNSSLMSLLKNLKSINIQFYKFYLKIYDIFNQNEKVYCVIENKVYEKISEKIYGIEYLLFKIINHRRSENWPKGIKLIIKNMKFLTDLLSMALNFLKIKFNNDLLIKNFSYNTNCYTFENIYKFLNYNNQILKDMNLQFIEKHPISSFLIDKLFEILRMNNDLMIYFSIFIKNIDYMFFLNYYSAEKNGRIIIHIEKIIRLIDDIFDSKKLSEYQKSCFFVIKKNLKTIITLIEYSKIFSI
ncbi:hypothetical protein DMUE_1384 [Dictyocoela muelleri]|nr:hypothetical protein DMUE_1384 [Dictyocoela muelleri]